MSRLISLVVGFVLGFVGWLVLSSMCHAAKKADEDDEQFFRRLIRRRGRRICARCGKDCGRAKTKEDTHGYCARCAEDILDEIRGSKEGVE